jgi:hypothetical protein
VNQTIAYETTKGTDSDPNSTYADPATIYAGPAIYADPNPTSVNPTVAATANVLDQIAFTFRVDELINHRITSARAKRRVFGSAGRSGVDQT